jgi:uncharacterized protein (TIGR03503 family)
MADCLKKQYTFLVLIFLSGFAYADSTNPKFDQTALLKERFQIDYLMNRAVLIVQREFGTESVILVRPDGSKVYSFRHPDNIKWVSGQIGDMIQISSPMPGPWQIIGKILPHSYINIYSQVGVEIEEFPAQLFQGEALKVTATLFGEELPIRMKGLEYFVDWSVRLMEDNTNEETNFESGTIAIGSYQDNGKDLDERPDDGVFTAELNLEQAPGLYLLQIDLENEIFSRQYQQYIEILPKPVRVTINPIMINEKEIWFADLFVDDTYIDTAETHIKLILKGPSHSTEEVVVNDVFPGSMLIPLKSISEPGTYVMRGSVFASNNNGRELSFQLEQVTSVIDFPVEEMSAKELEELRIKREARIEKERLMSDRWYRYQQLSEPFLEDINNLLDKALAESPLSSQDEAARQQVLFLILLNVMIFFILAFIVPLIMPSNSTK